MKTLAQEIFEDYPSIKTEDEVLGVGFERMRQQTSLKTARYCFWYDEDFPSDYVSEYFWLQRNQKGV